MDLHDWLQFLEHRETSYKNTTTMILTAGISSAALYTSYVALIIVLKINLGLLIYTPIVVPIALVLCSFWICNQDRKESKRAKILLDDIFHDSINDIDDIKRKWFNKK